jgi:aminopeptidase N
MLARTFGLVLLGLLACGTRPRHRPVAAPRPVVSGSAPEELVRVPPTPPGVLDILRYATRLRVDVRSRSVEGKTTITYALPENARSVLYLPRHGLDISGISSLGNPVKFQIDPEEIVLDLPRPTEQGGSAAIEIVYRGKPERGLVFGDALVYTDFFTCYWMPCLESPADRAQFRLELVVPAAYQVVAGGQHQGSSQAGAGQMEHVYLEEAPRATYLFGFAAGKFVEVSQRVGNVDLVFVGPGPKAALERRFEPTANMLHFLEAKAGVPLPGARYTQVLVPGSQAQEKSSFSLIGAEELDPILKDPSEDWVIAHELAHQWWGNLITCKDFRHFWLNEGIATFMVAAYKEHRGGAAAYAAELALIEKRYRWAADQGFDPKLAFKGDYPTLQFKRAITYSKAALFLDRLRREVGEDAFWRGLKAYTQKRAGQGVESRDFQQDFEAGSGRKVAALFDAWVYD